MQSEPLLHRTTVVYGAHFLHFRWCSTYLAGGSYLKVPRQGGGTNNPWNPNYFVPTSTKKISTMNEFSPPPFLSSVLFFQLQTNVHVLGGKRRAWPLWEWEDVFTAVCHFKLVGWTTRIQKGALALKRRPTLRLCHNKKMDIWWSMRLNFPLFCTSFALLRELHDHPHCFCAHSGGTRNFG